MDKKNKEELKEKIRRLLSVDARISMQDLATNLKTTKVNAYNLFNEVTAEYGMKFVPEICIDKLWKWEFIKRARLRTKRGILAEAVEELPLTGFGEFLVMVKFMGKKPKEDEVIKAMSGFKSPQFAAFTKGEYDLFIYSVERSYEDAIRFTDSLNKNLGKYNMIATTSKVWSNFGFFPLSSKLMEQFDIFDTYKNLLYGLNEGGRNTFTDIGKKFNQGPAQILYAYDRLARTEILKRVTYFESKPKATVGLIIIAEIENANSFEATRNNWYIKLLKEYKDRENECVFMCEMPSPKSLLILADFESRKKSNQFLSSLKKSVRGIRINSIKISKVLLGSLGARDFDMRYTPQYRDLERKKLVPSMSGKSVETPVENPNEI